MIDINSIINFLKEENIEYKYFGKNKLKIDAYSVPDMVKDNSVLWIKDHRKIENYGLENYDNLLIITSIGDDIEVTNSNYLVSDNSKELFFSILNHFFANEKKESFVGKSSTVETDSIGDNVYIGENCYISPNVILKNNITIKNNVVIEGDVLIGNGSVIFSGCVIGSDGYGYYQNDKGKNIKVPHLGGVIIGNNVEIGANTCIDKGTLGDTIVENNVKIDNLCHIAHNVHIKENASVIALSMIAGSVVLEENSYIAPSASVMNQLTIGENSIVGLGAVVVKNVSNNVVVAGVPAKIIRKIEGK